MRSQLVNFAPLSDAVSFLLLGLVSVLIALFLRKRGAHLRETRSAKDAPGPEGNLASQGPADDQPPSL
jgi:hypothetical protein